MYFEVFKPQNWRKRSTEARRRNCAVLPKDKGVRKHGKKHRNSWRHGAAGNGRPAAEDRTRDQGGKGWGSCAGLHRRQSAHSRPHGRHPLRRRKPAAADDGFAGKARKMRRELHHHALQYGALFPAGASEKDRDAVYQYAGRDGKGVRAEASGKVRRRAGHARNAGYGTVCPGAGGGERPLSDPGRGGKELPDAPDLRCGQGVEAAGAGGGAVGAAAGGPPAEKARCRR